MAPDEHAHRDLEAHIQAQIHAARAQLEAANERVNTRAGRNLPLAIAIALGLGVAFVVSLVFAKALFVLVAGVLVGFTLYELASALRFAGRDVPRVPLVVLGVILLPVTYLYGEAGLWFGTLAAVALIAAYRLLELWFHPETRTGAAAIVRDLAAAAFCIAYCAVLGSFAVLLAAQPGGEWWVLAFIVLTTAADTGALAAGVLFGKTPMAPRISPKKTWEGFAGAALVTLVAGVVLAHSMLAQPWWFGLILGGAILVSSTVGDLAESVIKRDLGIKDIGTWLPGHGGFLDRLDSILPSAVVAFALFELAT